MKDAIDIQVEINRGLIDKFPFLIPRNIWTDELIDDYDYTYTLLDEMPIGWYKAFGVTMCEELAEKLKKADFLYDYRVVEIKEKYGELRWYDNGVPKKIYGEVSKIIDKYTELSRRTCVKCGNPATKISKGWISPWCDRCASHIKNKENFIDINEWLGII